MKPVLTDDVLRGEFNGEQGAVYARERNLIELVKMVWRRRLLMLTCVGLALLAGVGFLALMPSEYTAHATLQLNTPNTEYADFDAVVSPQDVDELALGSEIHNLSSYPVALRVVEQLGLVEDAEFNHDLRDPSMLAVLLDEIADGLAWTYQAAATDAPGASSNIDEEPNFNVAANLLENLSVWNEGRSYTIFASFRSKDRVKAAEIANAFAETYVQRQLEVNSETNESVSFWLDRRLEQVRTQVRAAEARIESFRRENKLVNLGAEGSLAGQQLGQINRQLAEAGVKRSELEARLARARQLIEEGSASSIPEIINSLVIQRMRSEANALDRQRSELASTYGDNHPEMKAVLVEIGGLERKIDAEVANIIEGMAAELEVAIDRQAKLEESLANLSADVGDFDRANARLRELEREADASRALFQSLATRREQALALQDAQQIPARVVAAAVPPLKPSHPNKIAVMGLSLTGGLGLSLFLITLLGYRDRDRLRSPGQLERLFGVQCYGMVPEFGGEVRKGWFSWLRRKAHDSDAPYNTAIRRMRNKLQQYTQRHSPKIVMVTSSLPAEGKSTFSYAIALAFADAGYKTLVVDADIHRPKIASMLGMKDSRKDEREAPSPLRKTSLSEKGRLDALILADLTQGHIEGEDPLAGNLPTKIKTTAHDYDVVIIDTPPMVLVDDASLFADLASSIVYLVRWDTTPAEAVQSGLSRLRSGDSTPATGLVLSRTDLARHARLGYKDESFFSEQYGYYYSRS